MAYIGRSPQVGNYSKLDSIAASFNTSDVTFNLTTSGVAFTANQPTQLIISIDGVIQEPSTAYTVSGSTITFTSAPATGASFFGIALGDTLDIGVPSDNTVTGVKLASGAVSANTKLAATVVTAHAVADNAVTTRTVATNAITYNKLNANTAHVDRDGTFTKPQRGSISALGVKTGAVNIALTDANHYSITTNGNLTMSNPTLTSVGGQGGSIIFTSNGSYTVSWGSYWRFATGTAPTMSTVAGKQDRVDYQVISSNTIHAVATIDMLGTA